MNKRIFPIFLAIFALLASTLACSIGGELSLSNAHTAFDEDGDQPTSVFAPSDAIYVVADLSNATVGTVVNSKWYYVSVEGVAPNTLIDEANITIDQESFSGTVHFFFPAGSDWPVGAYAVELYLDGALIQTVTFSVQ
ncbi:MAG: hypothetical protein C4583_02600 [Anaerolineaceae bacterium]|nr:MAG: hypothetical protein C4583_02600 [Anaerolineaceae bacterium]